MSSFAADLITFSSLKDGGAPSPLVMVDPRSGLAPRPDWTERVAEGTVFPEGGWGWKPRAFFNCPNICWRRELVAKDVL